MIRDVAFPKARLLRKRFLLQICSFKYALVILRVELSIDKKAVSPDSSTQITGKCKKYKKKKHKYRWKIVSNMNKLVVADLQWSFQVYSIAGQGPYPDGVPLFL